MMVLGIAIVPDCVHGNSLDLSNNASEKIPLLREEATEVALSASRHTDLPKVTLRLDIDPNKLPSRSSGPNQTGLILPKQHIKAISSKQV